MEKNEIKLPMVSMEMPNENYHTGIWQKDFVSSTTLKTFLISPKYFKYSLNNPKQISQSATRQGSIFHSMLESIVNTGCIDGVFDEFFVFQAPINPKTGEAYGSSTKAFLEAYEQQKETNSGKTPCSEEELRIGRNMVDALLTECGQTSEIVNHLISIGTAEVSFFLEYEGAKFKFRTDLITKNKMVDWKSISADDLHEDTINKQISKMNYGFSAAFYQFFYYQLTGQWLEFLWVFQQKSAPYDAVIVSASDWAYSVDYTGNLMKGPSALEFEHVLSKYLECNTKGYFPGAESLIPETNGYRVMYAGVPSYKRNSIINFY